MLTITDNYTGSLPYPYERLGGPDGLLFFDIETTGLSARTSQLYLIGCLYTDGTRFYLRQWFAEKPADEPALLTAFQEYLLTLPKGCRLMHFNGNGFDLPYLRQKFSRYQSEFLLDEMDSLDLYRMVRPYKCVLGLPSLRQKAIEDYLGLVRQDPFDGGQLICVYEDYLDTRSTLGLKALLLHNEEDLRNMPKLLAVLNLNDYMEADYTVTGAKRHRASCLDGSFREELLVTLQSPVPLPRPISLRMDNGLYLTASAARISLAVPLLSMTLKHYFENARDYFYLPEEDRAVHKSVGIYVDKDHRTKATKENCYIKKQGLFIPCPGGLKLPENAGPAFRQDRKDKDFYLEWTGSDALWAPGQSDLFWNQYVHSIWKSRR